MLPETTFALMPAGPLAMSFALAVAAVAAGFAAILTGLRRQGLAAGMRQTPAGPLPGPVPLPRAA